MTKSVLAIASSEAVAQTTFTNLREAGFAERDISIVTAAPDATPRGVDVDGGAPRSGVGPGAVTGGVMGGAIAVLAGVGLLAIPGVGPFIAAGPIVAALGGVAVGAALGGLAGGLVALDLPEVDAKAYEARLRAGDVLIAVHPADASGFARAKAVLARSGATDIRTLGEAAMTPEVHTAQ